MSRLGGNDNAFTSHDATAYFQRVAKDRLPQVMAMEADRMVNLQLAEKEVLTERDVILEERRSRVENNPSAILDEQMSAALYRNHRYGMPVIGWEHEIAAAVAQGRARLLQGVLRAQQRDPRRLRRRHAGRGQEARRGDLRQAEAEPGDQAARARQGAAARARRCASS